MGVALLLAVLADKAIRGADAYRTLLIWPYAVAPAMAAVLWLFLFHPQIGLIGRALNQAGIAWDYKLNGNQAMLLVIIASAWKQVSYNFIFFLAGLQSIPRSVLEAAAIDGARPTRRFRTIIFPLLSPTTFFLLVVNLVYAFFDTFGMIHALTGGGPGKATETLVYKVYVDGGAEPRPRLVGGAIGDADGAGDRADRACSSASSSARCITDAGRARPRWRRPPAGGRLSLDRACAGCCSACCSSPCRSGSP